MRSEPLIKYCCAFFDGQNLYHSAKEAFNYNYPNYEPLALANHVCALKNWNLKDVFFYTGLPREEEDKKWHKFWVWKLAEMGRKGIHAYSRLLQYSDENIRLPDGSETGVRIPREKGIDVRIALDVVRLAWQQVFDVALIFSQDQDLTEAVRDVKEISKRESRWIRLASAYPVSEFTSNKHGINGTDWIQILKGDYDQCLDPVDYRKKL